MRVLYLTNNPNRGSTTRILQSWLPLGRQAGLESRVVVERPGTFAAWLADGGFVHRVEPMPWPSRWWPLRSLRHGWRLFRWLRRSPIDVIHCNEHDLYPFGLLMRRLLRRPLVCHVRFRMDRPFAEWAFGRGRRRPDALLWTSYQQRNDCVEAVRGIVPEERQHVLRLGLDLHTFGTQAAGRERTRSDWGFGPEDVVVGTASALRPRKRLEEFIALVAQLARSHPRVVGVLAGDVVPGQGDEAYRETILKQIEATGLKRRFRWLGRVEPIEPFLHAVDLFVSTSEYETFGMSVCEAMACRRAVAAYRGGSVHEVVGDAGRVVGTGDLRGLVAAAAELAEKPALRDALGQRARARVADCFNPADSLGQLRAVYASLRPVKTERALGARDKVCVPPRVGGERVS